MVRGELPQNNFLIFALKPKKSLKIKDFRLELSNCPPKLAPPNALARFWTLNQSERLRAHAPSAANFATQKFAPVHASHEQGVLGKYSRGSQNKTRGDCLGLVLAPPWKLYSK